MKNNITVLSQLLYHVDRDFFQSVVRKYQGDKYVRKLNSWTHFVVLFFAQLTGQQSIRDLVTALKSKMNRLYHAGIREVKRSTFSDANRDRTHEIFQEVFYHLVQKTQHISTKKRFRFKNKVKVLDSTTISLCLSLFPWAKFRQSKGAIKLHCEYELEKQIPTFLTITDGKSSDIRVARKMSFEKGTILVIDRGYVDYSWLNLLNLQGVFFVTRLKGNVKYRVIQRLPKKKKTGITADQIIRLIGQKANCIPIELRRIRYKNPEDGNVYEFLTNIFNLAATTITLIYKARWDIELFFKWVKQNLKIKTFLGTNENAVMSQIWAALSLYLIIAYVKYLCKVSWTMHKIFVSLKFNALDTVDINQLIRDTYEKVNETNTTQLKLGFT
ncbi:MAG: IS4 family transposase [Fidelibacterota bacterium]